MVFWIRKIQWNSLLGCGLLFTLAATIVRFVEMSITLRYYQLPEYSGVWSTIMVSSGGAIQSNFIITSLIFTFITGISLGIIYYYVRDLLPKRFWHRVTYFADLLIGTSFVFFTLPVYLLFHVPSVLLISWFISGFIIQVIGSYIFVRFLR
jgi:hypothetical protein